MTGHVAVIDIGKTNAKLALVALETLSEIAVITRPNTVLAGPPYRHFDVEGHWAFLLDGLAGFNAAHGIDAIVVTTHGAAAALIGADGQLAAPVLDYEDKGPETSAAAYNAIRPAFAQSGSPRLGMGLNIGAQLFWQFEADPTLKSRVQHIVTYPQYWGFRLTGVAASDVTSLGCHSDLWNPFERRFSSLVDRLDISGRLAPARPSGDVLGPILPALAAQTGLPASTPVYCGIHDSNASLLPHLLAQTAPFSVVSTGTWVIAMAIGGGPFVPDPARDTLINVNAFGDPVPSARFMGGREYDMAIGAGCAAPTEGDIAAILDSGTMLLPALAPETGPFIGALARWIGAEPAPGSGQRAAAIGFYLALVTARCLALIQHRGDIIVEGPFARNRCFLDMLGATTGAPIRLSANATGTAQGAALLAKPVGVRPKAPMPKTHQPGLMANRMTAYAQRWVARTWPGPTI